MRTVSYTHRQHNHIPINMWSRTFGEPPPTSKSCHHIAPNNCPRVVKELQLSTAVGWSRQKQERAGGQRREIRGGRVSLPGFVIKRYATLHLKFVGFVSFLFFGVFLLSQTKFLQIWQLNFWLCARILTCSLYWMDTWLGRQVLRTGAAHCEPPESAPSPPHQCFLKAYSHMAPCASLPAEVRQGNELLLCWQAQNPPGLIQSSSNPAGLQH